MDPVGLGQCSKLLVAAAFVIGGASPSLAFWASDKATDQTTQICDRSFAPENADAPYTRTSRARELDKACQWGAHYAHQTIYDPYKNSDSPSPEYPIVLPTEIKEFRKAYDDGITKCLTGYDGYSGLQERMACMDGYDYFAGNLVAHADDYVPSGVVPMRTFTHEYYQRRNYKDVYQDIADDQTWAYVLSDRVFHPERYPGYRRDQLFAPQMPDSQAETATRLAAASSGGGSTNTVHATSNNFWFWHWYWHHYHTCWSCSSYSPSASYRRDDGGRSVGVAGGSPPVFGTTAPARELSPGTTAPARELSPGSTYAASARPPAVRGGLGAYGGYAHLGDGAHASVPTGRSVTSVSGRAGGSMGNAGGGSTSYGAGVSVGSYGGAARASMGSMGSSGSSAHASAGGGGGGGHGGGSSGG